MNREISERLFLAETRFCENEKLLASRRWVVVVRTYPVVEVQFSADGRSTVRARAVCDDWDDVPPSVDLLDAEGTPLAKFPQGIGHSVFNNSAHPRTGRPFLCVPGIREYHEHGSHLSDKWDNYNDTYIASLVDAMYGAVRAVEALGVVDVDRIGHGGHSYGAFATANILANAPFFKAGIAGDGAYNRSLTPDGFQAERRSVWEAPQTYIEMSPFFKADQINTPLLMYHGGADNNTGTFPIQSERMISALTILGKKAVLYEYPYESHTPRAMENKLDMWARFVDWFDRYVKNADTAQVISDQGGN